MIIHHCEQRSDAWYDAKCGRVTGTRFKSLVSDPKTKTYQDLVTDMVAELITGQIEPSYSNDVMQRGIDMEAEAREAYEALKGINVHEVGFVENDGEFADWVGISPDGIIFEDNGMVEIKCPLAKTHINYIYSGRLPAEYRHQVQGQLFVTRLDYCDFMSYYPGMKPFIIRVKPDLKLFDQFTQRLRILIKEVQQGLEKYNNYET